MSAMFRMFGDSSFAGQDLSLFPYPPLPLRQRLAAFAGRNLLIDAWSEDPDIVDALFHLTFRAVESGFLAIGASPSAGGASDAVSDQSKQHIARINQHFKLLQPKLQLYSCETL